MMLIKLAAAKVVLSQLTRSMVSASWASAAALRRTAQGRDLRPTQARPRLAALAEVGRHLPGLLADRARIQVRRRVGQSDIERWFETDE